MQQDYSWHNTFAWYHRPERARCRCGPCGRLACDLGALRVLGVLRGQPVTAVALRAGDAQTSPDCRAADSIGR